MQTNKKDISPDKYYQNKTWRIERLKLKVLANCVGAVINANREMRQ